MSGFGMPADPFEGDWWCGCGLTWFGKPTATIPGCSITVECPHCGEVATLEATV